MSIAELFDLVMALKYILRPNVFSKPYLVFQLWEIFQNSGCRSNWTGKLQNSRFTEFNPIVVDDSVNHVYNYASHHRMSGFSNYAPIVNSPFLWP
ncbi:MAG: hypothetical protein CM15mP82_4280 [Methanobacteriota archaeon]|nr:MAG: hypothetical protein CM15mP82_4280 [Euryarchaeota archaeon]